MGCIGGCEGIGGNGPASIYQCAFYDLYQKQDASEIKDVKQ